MSRINPKFFITLVSIFIFSIFINYSIHHNIFVSFANSLTLSLSINLFKAYFKKDDNFFNLILIISFCFIPLFHYRPSSVFISLLPLLSVGFLYLTSIFPVKKWVILIWIIFLFFGNLFSSEVVKLPFEIQTTQLIFNSPEINYHLKRHQQDALYVPYKIRQLIYSNLIFVYASFMNFFDFLNLKNLFEVLLITNIYPLFIGVYKIYKYENRFRKLWISGMLITILSTGIDRSPDKFQSVYLLTPFFIYLIILGSNYINKKIYFILWALTLFLYINPKI